MIEIDFIVVHDLKGLSEILKLLNPGDKISITFLRAGKEITAKPKVVAK